jgi:hypothetical protein
MFECAQQNICIKPLLVSFGSLVIEKVNTSLAYFIVIENDTDQWLIDQTYTFRVLHFPFTYCDIISF